MKAKLLLLTILLTSVAFKVQGQELVLKNDKYYCEHILNIPNLNAKQIIGALYQLEYKYPFDVKNITSAYYDGNIISLKWSYIIAKDNIIGNYIADPVTDCFVKDGKVKIIIENIKVRYASLKGGESVSTLETMKIVDKEGTIEALQKAINTIFIHLNNQLARYQDRWDF